MLVLTRRPNESIIIANNIRITVVSVGPGRVKLGIEAPPHVRVDRKEIHDKIEQSADVLATVGGETPASETPNTVVAHGPDTALIVPTETSGATAVASEKPAETAAPPLPQNNLSKFRPPRKPR
jgi:carbon storage regulator